MNGLKNTIIHELLHTCVGCMNHKAKWKFYADKVNRAYGYDDIKRTSTADEKGVKEVIRKRKVNQQNFMRVSLEEAYTIRWHMGNFEEAYGSCAKAYSKCPLAVYLHLADVASSYLREAIFDYEKGEFR